MLTRARTIAVLLALVSVRCDSRESPEQLTHPAVAAQDSVPLRVSVEDVAGRSIGVPTVLLAQLLADLKKDLGDDEFLPKTVEGLAEQLSVDQLLLTDTRNAAAIPTIPRDAEFYWLAGPRVALCGAGGQCSVQLYWGSISNASAGRLFPTTPEDEAVAFHASAQVLSHSTNGLFDLSTYPASASDTDDLNNIDSSTLTFDGQRYVVQAKKQQ